MRVKQSICVRKRNDYGIEDGYLKVYPCKWIW